MKSFILISIFFLASFTEASPLRVMTYNIRHGEGLDKKVNLDRIAHYIEAYQPDFIALQEVDNGADRTNKENQAEVLAKKLNMHYAFGASVTFPRGGFYGNAFLSKRHIERYELIKLPDSKEDRSALVLEIPWFDQKLTFVATHFSLNPEIVKNHIRMITDKIKKNESTPKNLIFLGDLNLDANSQVLELLRSSLSLTDLGISIPTFKAPTPTRQIDFIFFSNESFEVLNSFVAGHPNASDHFGLLADLNLK